MVGRLHGERAGYMLGYNDAFDGYHSGKRPRAMELLFARYLDERLTHYLEILGNEV